MKLKRQYLSILKSNKRVVGKHRYTVPSSPVYPHQWLWDSCFHAIIYLSLNEFDYAKDEIRALLHGQWGNGMVPHMIYWEKSSKHNLDWGTSKNTSSITQPPMIAYAAERIYKSCKDKNFIFEIFESLDKYYKWLHKERSDDYVLSIIHPWESGEDDFVPWDNVLALDSPNIKELEKHKRDLLGQYVSCKLDSRKFMEKNVFNVKCLLFNCVYLRNLKSMYALSKLVNREQRYYKNIIRKVDRACKKYLYRKKIGLYSTIFNGSRHIKDFDNSSIFLPLFAGLLTKPQAKKLIEEFLLSKDLFWAPFGIPTISINNDNFEPNRYWRGSAWTNINWFIYDGLKDYGFENVAQKLKRKSMAMVEKSGFCEYYNPISGKGRGPRDFCWTGLIFDM